MFGSFNDVLPRRASGSGRLFSSALSSMDIGGIRGFENKSDPLPTSGCPGHATIR